MSIQSKTNQFQHCALVVWMSHECCMRLWNSSLKFDRFDVGYDEKWVRYIYICIYIYNIYLRSKSILFASRSQVITSFWMAWNEPREDGVLVIIDWGSLGSVLGTCTWSYKSVILGPWCHQTWNEMDGSMGKYEKKVIDMYINKYIIIYTYIYIYISYIHSP